jgi:drug/metabolite transporter (DMT)-like permease
MKPHARLAASPQASAHAPAAPATGWSALTLGELVLLGAIWGASFMFMRVAAPAFGPLALVELRLALGAVVLLPFLWAVRAQLNPRLLGALAVIGIVNSALPFALFAWAATFAPAGIGAICNALTVLFTAIAATAFFGERLNAARWFALALGLLGVMLLASKRIDGVNVPAAVAAGTTAAALYGIGANLVRKYLAGTLPSAAVAAATLSAAALFIAPAAAFTWPATMPGFTEWAAVVALGVVCTGLAFVLFYRLIGKIGAARAVMVTYLVPLFGVGWSWLLLDEPVTLAMAGAGALILGSIAMSRR